MAKKPFTISDFVKPEDVSKVDTLKNEIIHIPLKDIALHEKNFYELSDLDALMDSIALNGLIEPIIVMPCEEEGKKYKILSGHRRYTAFIKLSEENPEKYAAIPSIVQNPKSDILAELLLIEANRATRKMTSADTLKQAERYRELLAKLKEQGAEIPGRLRDVVAEAMNVSASRLARLNVIRKGLCPKGMQLFEENKLNESCAYTLAQAPNEAQEKVISGVKEVTNLTDWRIKERLDYLENLAKITCPDGSECENRDRMFTELCKESNMYRYLPCGHSEQCCDSCSKLYECKAACPQFADKIKKQKAKEKEKKELEKAEEETAALNRVAEYNKQWLREGFAREQAGVSIEQVRETLLEVRCYGYPYKNEAVEKYESGNCDDSYNANLLKMEGHGFAALAKLYSCSADYLLGLSDSPERYDGEWKDANTQKPDNGDYVLVADKYGLIRQSVYFRNSFMDCTEKSVANAQLDNVDYWTPAPTLPNAIKFASENMIREMCGRKKRP